MKVLLHAFLTLELAGVEWSPSRSGHFTLKEDRSANCTGICMVSRADLMWRRETFFDCARNGSPVSWLFSPYPSPYDE